MVAGIPVGKETTTDKFGVVIPKNYTVIENVDVAFIPLVACDKNKNRIGFGKGYYDKFLQNKNCIKVGICYDFQVVESITPNACQQTKYTNLINQKLCCSREALE